MDSILPHLLAFLLYGLGAIAVGRRCHRQPEEGSRCPRPLDRVLLTAAILAHGWGAATLLLSDQGLRLGFAPALSLTVWLAALFFWIESFYAPIGWLYILLTPIAALVCLLVPWLPLPATPVAADNPWLRLHLVVALLSYALFTLAALHAVLMSVLERALHRRDPVAWLGRMPPLLVMESLLFRVIGVAFVLLTITVLTGVVFSEALFGQPLRSDHKTVFTLLAWAIFGILLLGRRTWGWRGRVALRWTWAGFITLVLAYLGTHFVLEYLLQHR